ncbi:MAG: Zn-dependent protease [Bdellovibrionales bacterium]|nr:Zn-dependent protease [Bdellovibrionales bacterium]
MNRPISSFREHFESLVDVAFKTLSTAEVLACELIGEDSQFVRLNAAKVRQAGQVQDASLRMRLFLRRDEGVRSLENTFSLTGDWKSDESRLMAVISEMQNEVQRVPVDPYAVLPTNRGQVSQIEEGKLLNSEEVCDRLLSDCVGLDLAGIYAAGAVIRGTANSLGQRQWFYAENFSLDYSLYTPAEKAVKSTFAGSRWNRSEYLQDLDQSKRLLSAMENKPIRLNRGNYRAYLAPAAVADLVGMFSWGCVSERSIRKGESPLRFLRTGERRLSSLFSLTEDFTLGVVPRFNGEGDIAPERVPLIEQGHLVGSLVHSRTASEYGISSNGATAGEGFRSPSMDPGNLKREDILKSLGTGVYLSNLHYLNWSDSFEGRVTGMTRYACLWVEDGEVVGPIETMRWDDSLYRFFGSELLAITDFRSVIAETSTYHHRQLGGMLMPGILLKEMNFTL